MKEVSGEADASAAFTMTKAGQHTSTCSPITLPPGSSFLNSLSHCRSSPLDESVSCGLVLDRRLFHAPWTQAPLIASPAAPPAVSAADDGAAFVTTSHPSFGPKGAAASRQARLP